MSTGGGFNDISGQSFWRIFLPPRKVFVNQLLLECAFNLFQLANDSLLIRCDDVPVACNLFVEALALSAQNHSSEPGNGESIIVFNTITFSRKPLFVDFCSLFAGRCFHIYLKLTQITGGRSKSSPISASSARCP